MNILLVLLLFLTARAQHSEQPERENTTDLRSSMVLLSVEDIKDEKTIILERTPHLEHFLRARDEDKKEEIRKVDSKEAKKLEMDFASRFLKTQYELESLPGDCQVLYRLTLKGESQEICKKDEKKGQEIAPLCRP